MSETTDKSLLISEIELLLAEKRTHLAVFRTGAALFGLSVTAFGALIVFIEPSQMLAARLSLLPLLTLVAVAFIGGWQMVHAHKKISQVDDMVSRMEEKDKRIAELFLD